MQRGAVAAAFRTIPFKILTFWSWACPPSWRSFEEAARPGAGDGSDGLGQVTTLASIIDKINTERHEHIVTIEDPIEYLHRTRTAW